MLSVEAANVSVVDFMCCVVVNVVPGCCVVCSPGVSCLVVNCAEFCVCATFVTTTLHRFHSELF